MKVEITDGISREREAEKIHCLASVADPVLELRWGEERGVVLFALPAFLSSVIISLFAQTTGGGPGPHSGFAHVLILVLSFATCVELLPMDFH